MLLYLGNIPLCQVTVETVGGGNRVRVLWRGHIWQRAERSLIKSSFSPAEKMKAAAPPQQKWTSNQQQHKYSQRHGCSAAGKQASAIKMQEYKGKVCASMHFLSALRRLNVGKITLTLSSSAVCSQLHDDRVKIHMGSPSHSYIYFYMCIFISVLTKTKQFD